jgi:transposase
MSEPPVAPIPAPAPAPAPAPIPAVAPATCEPGERFARLTHFGGFDWGNAEHQFVAVDRQGQIVLSLRFANDAQGWALFRQRVAALPALGVAIETCCGPAVERLVDIGLAVYPMNPKAAERYRDRKAPSGAKDDAPDAWSFADALRTDGHGWRPLLAQDPLTTELRLLCRDEVKLIEQRTALVNQLRAALCEYYPAALDAFDDWTAEGPWRFVIAFPDPPALAKAGKRRWEKFLHAHKLYRPQTADRRMAAFAGASASASPNPAVTRAKSLLAVTVSKQLCLLESQLEEYRRRVVRLFADHPDHDCFGSLPGAGAKLAPRLLAELGANRAAFATAEALQNYAGTSPVTRQSGRSRVVVLRRACNKTLRATVHLWADLSRRTCVWAETYYQQKRAGGMNHTAALRCLGQRWVKILWKMWQTRKPYDEALHTRNQTEHGSWVIRLLPPAPAKA